MKRLTLLLLIVTLVSQAQADAPEPTSIWEFDSPDYSAATVGVPLELVGTVKPVAGIVPGDGAVQIGEGSYYICTHGIAPNGGGAKVNEWTLLIDFSFPPSSLSDPPSGYNDLFQTNPTNIDDSDWTINSSGAVGIGAVGYSSTKGFTTKGNTWYRMVLVVDNGTRHDTYFDGVEIFKGNQQGIDGRFSLASTILLFCAGNNQDRDDAPMNVSTVAFWDKPLTAEEIAAIGRAGDSFFVRKGASNPTPSNGSDDVLVTADLAWAPGAQAATHNVYFGASREEIAAANPAALVAEGLPLDVTTLDVGLLEYGQTYYWRVDGGSGAPGNTVFEGQVWSFTTEPYGYPISAVTATASSAQGGMGAQNTVNGSGLGSLGQHSTDATQMWTTTDAKPHWIRFEFEDVYRLHEMWVWNSNQVIEPMLGLGAKDVAIEYSLDGQTWTALDGVPEFAQAPGAPGYEANTTVDFGGVDARFVKLTINANWGGVAPQTGLAEVRFFYVPVQAFEPKPVDGAKDVGVEASLDWRPGRQAESHKVYLGTDKDAMTLAATVADHGYTPASLNLGTTYFWRIDEVGAAGVYEGKVWSFTTEEYAVVDDFEGYTDAEGSRIYEAWIDGLTTGASGSQVGYDSAPFAEKAIVHSGTQSMPLTYNNLTAGVSEAELTFSPQDWTRHGVTSLVLYFRGQLTNTPASLYVKINGTKVAYNSGAPATAMNLWKQWSIPLAATGANLKSVRSLTIGVEGAGAKGTLFFDDIRLYATAPAVAAPADPGTTGLVAFYKMDGDVQDSSGRNYHGATNGVVGYETGYAGQALVFNGTNAYVDLPIGPLMPTLTDMTVATHINFVGGSSAWQRIFDFGSGTSSYMFLCPRQGTSGNMRFGIRSATVAEQIVNSPAAMTVGWHHTAIVIDSQARTLTLYVDGEPVASGVTSVLPKDLGTTTQNWLGRSQYTADGYLHGSLDDLRIYNRALSQAELRYLAGDR